MFINSLQNEKVLLKELSESNERAFEKIYYFYGPRIYGHVLKLVKSESFAQDLLQDIFVSIWDHRQNINPEKSFRSYLFRISENKVYDFFRKLARDKKLYEQFRDKCTNQYSDIEEVLFNKENAGILQKAINSLPPQRRRIFKLCKIDGQSYDQVSEQLKISTSTISDHIVKANHCIRNYLWENYKL